MHCAAQVPGAFLLHSSGERTSAGSKILMQVISYVSHKGAKEANANVTEYSARKAREM